MNCQEVVTLMQRELDQDLNDAEEKLLAEHLNRCSACSDMYERLKMLNEDLEMLPKVTPPFSIVDSILPKLDEMDREQAAAIASSFTTGVKEQQMDQPIAEKQTNTEQAKKLAASKKVNRFNWKAASAVVAAAAVFGLILVNAELPKTQEAADFAGLSIKTQTSQNKESDSSSASVESRSIQQHDESIADTTEPKGDGSASDTSTPAVPDNEGSTETMDMNEGAANQVKKQDDQPVSSQQERSVNPSTDHESGNKGLKPTDSHRPTPAAGGGETAKPNSSNGSSENGNPEQGIAEQPPIEKGSLNDQVPTTTENLPKDDPKSAFNLLSEMYSVSPNQAFEVVWNNGELKLLQKSGDASSLISTIAWQTKPEHMTWSEDSKQVQLHFTNAEKQVFTLSYDVSTEGFKKAETSKAPDSVIGNTETPSLTDKEATKEDASKPESKDNSK
ncbi:anti-sigma factor family protein [Paenibacillus sp. 1001270B_150601_E10]|uniref:anti-sigma factor family protein n=1 Tax=Paenibacillus sp. 1001270B_150601_E10 TaxID=2787079 RepID=UPI00189CA53D|nr:zf-HC2 domain-containing protein [Paenibacillus sp. 1001270B_150601_E10]